MANLRNRSAVEASFRRRMNRLSAAHRAELVRLLGSPPDIANVPQAFWDKVQREQEEALAALLMLIFVASANQHGLTPQTSTQPAREYADGRAAEVAGQYVEHSRASLERASQRWRELAKRAKAGADAVGRGGGAARAVSPLEVERAAQTVSGPQRDERIIVSETTDATSAGAEHAVAKTVGQSDDDTWQTVEDRNVCPICRPLHGKKRPHWSKRFAKGPRAHPGCRCEILYANLQSPQPELEPAGAA